MIREIENRRSIRKYKPDEIERKKINWLTGIVAVGFADEAPDKRPRKPFEEIVEVDRK